MFVRRLRFVDESCRECIDGFSQIFVQRFKRFLSHHLGNVTVECLGNSTGTRSSRIEHRFKFTAIGSDAAVFQTFTNLIDARNFTTIPSSKLFESG